MSRVVAVGVRLFVIVAVAGMVVLGVALGAALLPVLDDAEPAVEEAPDHPEFDVDRIAPDRIDAGGQASPDAEVGTVLFDQTNDNRFEAEDVKPLMRAITDAGGDVTFTPDDAPIGEHLDGVDVLVVVDPGQEYGEAEVDAVREFVDDGGQLLILGGPTRTEIQEIDLGAELTEERSELTSLGSAFGITFDTQYLYDMEYNDGNFKNVVVGPATEDPTVEGVEEVTMYTAAAVEVGEGTVLLETAPTAERSGGGAQATRPVAVQTADGSVIAVGDTRFLSDQYHDVADNEVFIERLVEFMAQGDRGDG